MLNKRTLIWFFLFFLLCISIPNQTFANPSTVTDCIEHGDCPDMEEELESDQAEDGEDIVVSKNSNLAFDIVKMVFALLLILLLIYVILKVFNRKNRVLQQVNILDNLGGVSVGANKSIQMIRVGKKIYMIGVGETVELLEEITDEDVKKDILNSLEDQKSSNHPIDLKQLFSRKDHPDEEKAFQTLFSRELDQLKKSRKNIINKHHQKDDEHE